MNCHCSYPHAGCGRIHSPGTIRHLSPPRLSHERGNGQAADMGHQHGQHLLGDVKAPYVQGTLRLLPVPADGAHRARCIYRVTANRSWSWHLVTCRGLKSPPCSIGTIARQDEKQKCLFLERMQQETSRSSIGMDNRFWATGYTIEWGLDML